MNNVSTRIQIIDTRYLISDPAYQRPLDMKRVRAINAAFNPNLVNPAKVSDRDGKYYIFDGQHTVAALKLRNGNRDLAVECRVYSGLTQEDEAELFAQQNGVAKAVPTANRLKALYLSKDREVVKMVELTERIGLKMDFSGSTGMNKIVAVAKAWNIFQHSTPDEYSIILTYLKEAWHGAPESLTAEMLGGMYKLYQVYKNELSLPVFLQQLAKLTPQNIKRESTALPLKGDLKYAMVLYENYNKGLRKNRLSDEIRYTR